MEPRNKFIWKAPHHIYIGLFIIFMGWLMDPWDYYKPLNYVFYILGSYITIDDIIEHTITRSTPLRLFFDRVISPFIDFIHKIFFR